MYQTEVAIVGAGPIGIELAVALQRAGVSHHQIEAGQVGSTFQWYAPGTFFFSSPERIAISGVPIVNTIQTKTTREEYLAYLRGVVEQFDLPIRTYTRVTSIQPQSGGGFVLELQRSHHGVGGPGDVEQPARGSASPPAVDALRADKVVLAIGNLHRPRLLGIPGEQLGHVTHYLADPHEYFRKRVVIIGGKNSAVEAAIRLFRVGCDVTISYRGERFAGKQVKYWLLPELMHLIKKGRIGFLPKTVPVEITGECVRLASVGATEEASVSHEVPADFVLVLTGYLQDSTLFEQAGVVLEGERRIPTHDPQTMETNVSGLYVAGTATSGTHLGRALEFIETAHVHVDRIVAALTGDKPPERSHRPDENFLEN